MPVLFSLHRVSFQFPSAATRALTELSLEIQAGDWVAVAGANGSGKTTLIRHLNGLLIPTQGKVLVDGLDTRLPDNRPVIFQRVGMVFQNPEDQIIASSIEEDVAFGPENLGLPSAEIHRRVEGALRRVGLWEARQRSPHLLSAGQMQRLVLAGVLAMRPRCVIFDEATSMLDPAGRQMALEMMADLHAEGLTVIFITHLMDEIAWANRLILLDHGRVAVDGPPGEVLRDSARLELLGLEQPPAAALAGRLRRFFPALPALQSVLKSQDLLAALPGAGEFNSRITALTPVAGAAIPAVIECENTGPVVAVRGLVHTYMRETPLAQRALQDVDLTVAAGRSHGLAGQTGSGKSTLLQHLNGILRPQVGTVQVGPYHLEDRATATRDVITFAGLVFQNPETHFFEQFVGDEIAFGPRQLKIRDSLAERVRWAMDLVGLPFEEFKDRPVYALSGGEKRKVALAATLAFKPALLLLDEPAAGLDPHSHRDLIARLKILQSEGELIVISSHNMEDMVELAEDLSVFQAGRRRGGGPVAVVFADGGLMRTAGLQPPLAWQAAEVLREHGWPLRGAPVSPERLETEMARCLGETAGG